VTPFRLVGIWYHKGMYIRPFRKKRRDGTIDQRWALVESYRTELGPRQRIVAYLGDVEEDLRDGMLRAVNPSYDNQVSLFNPNMKNPAWVDIDFDSIAVESSLQVGGILLGHALMEILQLPAFLATHLPKGREEIPWGLMAEILILLRLYDPSSELRIAEHLYMRTAFQDLLGVPWEKVNDDRLYRTLDALLPQKEALELHLKTRCGELFNLSYDLLLYDVTSTYFEGMCSRNKQAKHGHSRDMRSDCRQVCIALVVSREGMPLGYEVFDGNRNDMTTVKEIVDLIEKRYGKAERIWVMDRGMCSEVNLTYLRSDERRYILGAPRSALKQFRTELSDTANWQQLPQGVEVKLCPSQDGLEMYVLCRSASRKAKEEAMHRRFITKIEEELMKIHASCSKRKNTVAAVERRIGRLLQKYSRGARYFTIKTTDNNGSADVTWTRADTDETWSSLSEGCYVLRSNILTWSAADLWEAYIQLTQAEAAFNIQKNDLGLRPIWHQKKERVHAHILVCFLAYVLWKTLGMICKQNGLGDEPRRVFDEMAQMSLVTVSMKTRSGHEIRKRCVTKPTALQAELIQRLKISIPKYMPINNFAQDVVTQNGLKYENSSVKGTLIGG